MTTNDPASNAIAKDIAAIRGHVRALDLWLVKFSAICMVFQLVFVISIGVWLWHYSRAFARLEAERAQAMRELLRDHP